MELYTLDGLLRRTEIIEGYESFLWADRYAGIGDVQIVMASTQQNRNLLASGTLLGLSESKTVMKVETIEDKEDSEGRKLLTIKGRELKNILSERIAMTGDLGTNPGTWVAIGTPGNVIRQLIDYTIRGGGPDPTDAIPLLIPGSLYATGNIPEEVDEYRIEREFSSLLPAVQEIADIWDLGYRLYRGPDDGTLYFDVYKGNDRTSGQDIFPPVIFSPNLESLQNVSEFTSVAKSKNVAYVYNDNMAVTVYGDGANETTAGLAKRTLFVDGTDLEYEERTYTLTEDQKKAIDRALRLESTTDAQVAALVKLRDKLRFAPGEAAIAESVNTNTETTLNSTDKTNLEAAANAADAAVADGYSLTTDQEAAVNKATDLSSLQESQQITLLKIRDRKLIDPTEASVAIAVKNNVVFSLLASERAAITAAIAVSVAAEPAEWDALEALLIQRGTEELAKNRSISAFDGEITQLSPYKYNLDYELGDLVEMRNNDGLTNQMLVIEQIHAADESGERAYPTLAIKQFITPGSWLAWESNQVWQDAPGVWADA
jgi:hypothetical protein